MFISAYLAFFKAFFRQKQQMFWLIAFPIAMSVLFFATLGNLDAGLKFSVFPVGVVENQAMTQEKVFQEALDSVSVIKGTGAGGKTAKAEATHDNKTLFEKHGYADLAQADQALKDGIIDGYYFKADAHSPVTVVTVKNDINQTIMKEFSDSVYASINTFKHIAEAKTTAFAAGLAKDGVPPFDLQAELSSLGQRMAQGEGRVGQIEKVSLSQAEPNTVLTYYYDLLAMVCLYASFSSIMGALFTRADLTQVGMRVQVSAMRRTKLILANTLAAFSATFLASLVVLAFMSFVLGANFGDRIFLVLLTVFFGNLLGITVGMAIASIPKLKEGPMIGIAVGITMFGCFLAGMMGDGIKYTIVQYAPLVDYMNPVARISDAFYSLYYYTALDKYWQNLVIITAMAAVFMVLGLFQWRKTDYEKL